ncbi:MAG: hypothetical protein HOW73_48015 [Polyangiaceae bacterium]|nr:hypothetical protein [Polyangiaceae bacterium]
MTAKKDMDGVVAALEADLERSYASLGTLVPDVLAKVSPHVNGEGTIISWPAHIRGMQRIVRRPDGNVLFVTQGLSFPFSLFPGMADTPALGYELAIEVPGDERFGESTYSAATDADLSQAWPVEALWFLSHCYLEDRWPLLERLEAFGGLITGFLPPIPDIEHHANADGLVGILLGIPLSPEEPIAYESQRVVARHGDHVSRVVVVTLMTNSEYTHVTGVLDSSRAKALAEHLRRIGMGHVSATMRGSLV